MFHEQGRHKCGSYQPAQNYKNRYLKFVLKQSPQKDLYSRFWAKDNNNFELKLRSPNKKNSSQIYENLYNQMNLRKMLIIINLTWTYGFLKFEFFISRQKSILEYLPHSFVTLKLMILNLRFFSKRAWHTCRDEWWLQIDWKWSPSSRLSKYSRSKNKRTPERCSFLSWLLVRLILKSLAVFLLARKRKKGGKYVWSAF